MRLSILDRGHFPLRARLMMTMMRVMSGYRAPDVVKLHYFNYERVGKKMGANFQAVMRGPSAWTIFDREVIAAYVSRLNACHF